MLGGLSFVAGDAAAEKDHRQQTDGPDQKAWDGRAIQPFCELTTIAAPLLAAIPPAHNPHVLSAMPRFAPALQNVTPHAGMLERRISAKPAHPNGAATAPAAAAGSDAAVPDA